MDTELLQMALGGLLHDIGKFAHRAEQPLPSPYMWNEESKATYQQQHALYTAMVINQIIPPAWAAPIEAFASRHHQPRTHLERVISLANQLAAGESRTNRTESPQQLESIFYRLRTPEGGNTAKRYIPLKRLAMQNEVIFPQTSVSNPTTDYKTLWNDFLAQATALKEAQTSPTLTLPYLAGLLDLMQRYCWSIPAAYYQNVADVNLYDHSRMTAALATCCHQLPAETVESLLQNEQQRTPVAVLVGGDISGVQKFIYNITSRAAAKSLRGRSFYLQLLTETVARFVLHQLKLPMSNLIYTGGGNFFLLAGIDDLARLNEISVEVTTRLRHMHEGSLLLILQGIPVTAAEFDRRQFSQAWQRLHQELNRAKLKPFANLENSILSKEILGTALGSGGDEETICNVCGREDKLGNLQSLPNEATLKVCALCASFEALGRDLGHATHLITLYSQPQPATITRITDWQTGLQQFGMSLYPVTPWPHQTPPPVDLSTVAWIEQTPLKEQATSLPQSWQQWLNQTTRPVINTYRLFAQLVPTKGKREVKTFDDLAKEAIGGFKRWGVLRMDVDNLGQLFETGFQRTANGQTESYLTLSRIASLSMGLRLFFEGWLPYLARADSQIEDRLYIQYAGGDDLFVVGSWDALPEFALKIRESFQQYVCANPYVTLSGGISLAPAKYPLYQAASDAEQAENQAKQFQQTTEPKQQKNAISFLGQTVDWETLHAVHQQAKQLVDWCGEGPLPHGFVQQLLQIYNEYLYGKKLAYEKQLWRPGQLYYGPWMWHLAYHLTRRIEDKRTPNNIKPELRKLEATMLNADKIDTLGLSARWAQFLIRK